MAGTIIADKIQTENSFLTLNVGQTLVATINSSGILNSSGGTMIGANGTVSNTAITGLVTASQIATVANTQITGNITSSQITSNPTLYGNVSVTGVIGVGGATTSTSGSGISFPATQSASTDANTLDDYEEGTWTPAITFGGGSTGITYSTQLGFYTKIGNTVTVQFRINLSNKGSSTGAASLGGLPFTTGGTYSQNYIIHDNSAGFNAGFGMYWSVENGATSGDLRQIGTNGSSGLSDTNFQNNIFLTGILTYRV